MCHHAALLLLWRCRPMRCLVREGGLPSSPEAVAPSRAARCGLLPPVTPSPGPPLLRAPRLQRAAAVLAGNARCGGAEHAGGERRRPSPDPHAAAGAGMRGPGSVRRSWLGLIHWARAAGLVLVQGCAQLALVLLPQVCARRYVPRPVQRAAMQAGLENRERKWGGLHRARARHRVSARPAAQSGCRGDPHSKGSCNIKVARCALQHRQQRT